MTNQPTDHRAQAEQRIQWAGEPVEWDRFDRTDSLLAEIRHALTAIAHDLHRIANTLEPKRDDE